MVFITREPEGTEGRNLLKGKIPITVLRVRCWDAFLRRSKVQVQSATATGRDAGKRDRLSRGGFLLRFNPPEALLRSSWGLPGADRLVDSLRDFALLNFGGVGREGRASGCLRAKTAMAAGKAGYNGVNEPLFIGAALNCPVAP